MIRLRSNYLLSGVSAVAVMTALGVANPALAGQTITGVSPPVTNTVSDDFIDVQANAVVQADGSNRSIFNSGTLTAFLHVTAATLTGSISNSGSIAGNGVRINGTTTAGLNFVSSNVGGGITNTGVIFANGFAGVQINDDSIVSGGIHNSGTAALIRGITHGIYLSNNATLNGGITNDGTIVGFGSSFADGITLNGAGVVLNGGITNTGTITALVSSRGNGINLAQYTAFNGNIVNSGRILTSGGSISNGINITGGVFTGSIVNQAGARIVATSGTGVNVNNGAILNGNVDNAGTITGTKHGVVVDGAGTTLAGNIHNASTGTISATGATSIALALTNGASLTQGIQNQGLIAANNTAGTAVLIDSSTFAGGITNSGKISAAGGGGSAIVIRNGGTFLGGIDNSGQIVSGSTAVGIYNNTFAGGINNSGTIATNSGRGVNITSGIFIGDIVNTSTGTISSGGSSAIQWSGNTFSGNITNNGLISSSGSDAINLLGGTFSGNVTNAGRISANSSGIDISAGTFVGNVTNSGTIDADNAINLNGGTFTGNILNSGLINATGNGIDDHATTLTGDVTNSGTINSFDDGIHIHGTTYTGNILNSGLINSTSSSGMDIRSTTIVGNVTNSGEIIAFNDGIKVRGTSFTGNVLNTSSGIITSSNNGINITTTTFNGNVTNAGGISASFDGIRFSGTALNGTITNSGAITAGTNGIGLVNAATLTGNISNTGAIDSNVRGIFVEAGGTVTGAITNSKTGTIFGSSRGLDIDGTVSGGITNAGTIASSNVAIDLANAAAGHTITQTGGLIQGNNGGITTALNMNNAFADTFNGNGGVLDGNINGDLSDTFAAAPTTTFSWFRGKGTVGGFTTAGSTGTVLFGATKRGEITTDPTTLGAFGVTHAGGTLYLDDQATINAFGYSQSAGTKLEYFLTSNNAQHGVIDVFGATLDGTLAAYVDPISMASAHMTAPLTYAGVVQTGIPLATTFSNAAAGTTLVTNSAFFSGTIVYNPTSVDINLTRNAFNAAGFTSTPNQLAVAGGLETIYQNNLVLSPEMTDAFAALLSSPTTAAYQAQLDELSGAQHAQLQQVTQSLTGQINELVSHRMDATLLTQDGVRMSGTVGQQYAQAVALSASDASSAGLRGSQGLTRGPSGVSVWARAYNNLTEVNRDPNAPGYDQRTEGGVGGVDMANGDNETFGVAVGYGKTKVAFDPSSDRADVTTWQVNLYGSYGFGNFYADAQAGYGWHNIDTRRTIDLLAPAGSVLATASYDAKAWNVDGEIGAIWGLGRVNMQPSINLAYVGSNADGFREVGPAYALAVSGADASSLASTLALRASGKWMMAKTPVVPELKIGWRHEYGDTRYSFTSAFLEDPTVPMNIVSSNIQPDSLVIGAGTTFGVTHNVEIFFDMSGQYNADAATTNASAGLRATW